jgi:hypothetical protein
MNKLYLVVSIAVFAMLISISKLHSQATANSVEMGAGYANDVYYSFSNGTVHTVDRTNWDVAFYTLTWSAGVIINEGNGVELSVYANADTSGWNAIDTTGLSSWPKLYNSLDSWEEGAFNQPPTNHPDYGWGVYNTITHDVVGDSIYILKLEDGSYKKFWIKRKISIENVYMFRFANLDGSEEVNVSLNCNDYNDKNFVYYSLTNQEIVDRDPASDSWDILFTKYMALVQETPYPVTGVLNNINVPANRFEMVDLGFDDWTAAPMDSTKSPIGYDWKYFDMANFEYVVEDSMVFFVRNFDEDVYKLVFTAFDYTQGKAVFEKEMISAAAVKEDVANDIFQMFPNPAKTTVNIVLSNGLEEGQILISDISGKVVKQIQNVQQNSQVDIGDLPSGLYFVSIISERNNWIQKLMIK